MWPSIQLQSFSGIEKHIKSDSGYALIAQKKHETLCIDQGPLCGSSSSLWPFVPIQLA